MSALNFCSSPSVFSQFLGQLQQPFSRWISERRVHSFINSTSSSVIRVVESNPLTFFYQKIYLLANGFVFVFVFIFSLVASDGSYLFFLGTFLKLLNNMEHVVNKGIFHRYLFVTPMWLAREVWLILFSDAVL